MTREEAKKWIEDLISTMKEETSGLFPDVPYKDEVYEALDEAVKALSQEPFINKPCVSNGACEHDKQKILDKIRAEFISRYPKNYMGEPESGGASCVFSLDKVLAIIDKYKEE